MLNQPPRILLTAISQLQSNEKRSETTYLSEIVSRTLNQNQQMIAEFSNPGLEQDQLFHTEYDHTRSAETCNECDKSQVVTRAPRILNRPQIHYGLIASGNQVIKDARKRDQLAQEQGILCFEMEAGGLMNQLPCLVIRGICDYCDSHKNKQWQGYAALTAAAYSKQLLFVVSIQTTRKDEGTQKSCWMVPFVRNPRFVGRHPQLEDLEKRISANGQSRKAAITGLGGVGKTQVALELAYRIREIYPKCSIFWVPCTSVESVEQGYLSLSQQLGLPNIKPGDVKSEVHAYLSHKYAGQWLLIFDNADDPDMWISGSDTTPSLKVPQSSQGYVLFTTRNRQLAVDLVSSDVIEIPEMDETTAITVLQKSLIQKQWLDDHHATMALLRQLTFLPLAITQAAAYINRNGISFADYLSLLQEQEEETIELLSQDFQDEWRYREIKNPVATTWLISFYQIQTLNPLAADYLSFLACVNPREVPQSLLPPAPSKIKQQSALGLLDSYLFISIQPGTGFLNVHRLVHLATRNWLRKEGSLEEWIAKTGSLLSEIFPTDDHENRTLWRNYLPHAQFCLDSKEYQSPREERERLLWKVGQCLSKDGRYNEAEKCFSPVMQDRKINLGLEHPDTLTSMANLASTYWSQGRWSEAEQLEVQVLEISKIALGPEHPDTLTSMANLASTYQSQGRWSEAEQLEVQVLEISKIALGPEHPDTLTCMANLASTYWRQGRWSEAEQLGVQVLETSKMVLGPEHPSTLIRMNNLAYTWKSLGRNVSAAILMTKCIKVRSKILGPNHPDTLSSITSLADWQEASPF